MASSRSVDIVLDLIANPQQWLVIGLPAVALLAIIGWRWPTLLLLGALATFAVGPDGALQGVLPEPLLRWLAPARLGLLVVALLANMAAYGARFRVRNWPALAVLLMLVATLALIARDGVPDGDPAAGDAAAWPPGVDVALVALALALPWSVVQVVLEQRTRQRHALLIGLLPLLSVAIGTALHVRGLHPVHLGSGIADFQLQGAATPGWFGLLAFAGFALAGFEFLRTREKRFAWLAGVDLALAVLSGSRMAVFACLVVALLQALLSQASRARLGWLRMVALTGAGVVASLLVVLLPSIRLRLAGVDAPPLPPAGESLWAGAVGGLLDPPLLGPGLGSSLVGGVSNSAPGEYLRLLAETGVVGLGLLAIAIVLWGRDVLGALRSSDRGFALALLLALAIYAITDDVLVMAPTVVLFVYLDAMIRQPRQHDSQELPMESRLARLRTRDAWGSASTQVEGRDRAAPVAPGLGPIEAALRRAGPVPATSGDAGFGAGDLPAAGGGVSVPPPAAVAATMAFPGLAAAIHEVPASIAAGEQLAADAQAHLEEGDLVAARATLARATGAARTHAAVEAVQAAIELAELAERLPELEALLSRLEADEDDQVARRDLAAALFHLGQIEEAVDLLLISVRKDRDWQDQAARRQLIQFFAALGPRHPITVTGRRKLAAVLYT